MRFLSAIFWTLVNAVGVVARALLLILRSVIGTPLRLLGRLLVALARRAWAGWKAAGPWRRWALVTVSAAVVLSVGLWGGAKAFAAFSAEYGFHPDTDGQTWRELKPGYATVTSCTSCHQTEAAKLATASHVNIGCESCHGPLSAHAIDATESKTAGKTIQFEVVKPTDTVCQNCHVKAEGRPSGFRDIKISDHYLPVCLQCHDPHTAISRRPPVVGHTLENLPTCVTCHGPEGFKKRDIWHPITATDDGACLLCHLPGRGPSETREPHSEGGASGWTGYPLTLDWIDG